MFEKKRKSLPLIELDEQEVKKDQLPYRIQSILEEMEIPKSLREIADMEPTTQLYKSGSEWFLDYKSWRVIFGFEPDIYDIKTWKKIIDSDSFKSPFYDYDQKLYRSHIVTLENAAQQNANGRTMCACGKFGSCAVIRLVKLL